MISVWLSHVRACVRRAGQLKAQGITMVSVSWGNVDQSVMSRIASSPPSFYQIYRPSLTLSEQEPSVFNSTGEILERFCPEVHASGSLFPLPPLYSRHLH